MKRAFSGMMACTVACALAACGQPSIPEQPSPIGPAPTAVHAQAIEPGALANVKVTLAPDHFIEFVELEPGDISIHESGRMDGTPPVLSRDLVRSRSAVELFRRFAPKQAAVPQELVDAVTRQRQVEASRAVQPNDPDGGPSGSVLSKPPNLLIDWNMDYQWFYSLACPTHLAEFCVGNVSSAWTKKDKTLLYTYFEVTGMNASEHPSARARLFVDRTKLLYPGTYVWRSHWWKDNIMPRWYHTAYFTALRAYFGKVEASGPEARAHFASGASTFDLTPF